MTTATAPTDRFPMYRISPQSVLQRPGVRTMTCHTCFRRWTDEATALALVIRVHHCTRPTLFDTVAA